MIERLLPPVVRLGEAFSDRADAELSPEENAAIARAVEKRRREFATVRRCARDALVALGVEPAPILSGPRGEPLWPPGVVGSMTHCPGYRGAVVARSTDVAAVGIDAEVDQPLPPRLLARIARPEELERLGNLDGCGVSVDRLLFCVKEAVYKTWYPLTHRFLDFHEASVTLHADGTFAADLRPHPPVNVAAWPTDWPTAIRGRWLAGNGLVLSAGSILAP